MPQLCFCYKQCHIKYLHVHFLMHSESLRFILRSYSVSVLLGIAKLITHINSMFKSKISSCPQKPLVLLIFYFHQSNGVNYCFYINFSA